MAYDEGLTQRIREMLGTARITEKMMFCGRVFARALPGGQSALKGVEGRCVLRHVPELIRLPKDTTRRSSPRQSL